MIHIAKLPLLTPPSLKVLSGTSVEVAIDGSSFAVESEFSRFSVHYSTDPNVNEHVFIKKMEASPGLKRYTAVIENLTNAAYYYFKIRAGYVDVDGPLTEMESLKVDVVPGAPENIKATTLPETGTIQVEFKAPEPRGSAITSYRLYQSSSSQFETSYLLADVEVSAATRDQGLVISFPDPQIDVSYFFKVAAVNGQGEGEWSTVSAETILDYPPLQPLKPTIKRKSTQTVVLSATVPNGKGSVLVQFILYTFKVGPNGLEEENKAIVSATKPNEIHHTIQGLASGTSYQFQIQAQNKLGLSPKSELSEIVNIDALVPAIAQLSAHVLSPTSLSVTLPTQTFSTPKLLGIKLYYSLHPNLPQESTPLIPLGQTHHQLSELNKGEVYYISGRYIGEHEGQFYSR